MWKTCWPTFRTRFRLRFHSSTTTSSPLDQLKSVTKDSLDELKTKLITKTFKYPYNVLNGVKQNQAEQLLDKFEGELYNDYKKFLDQRDGKPFGTLSEISIADYFRPQMRKASPILYLVYLNMYPDDLAELKGYKSKKDVFTGILTNLFHELYLGQVVHSIPKEDKIDTYWDMDNPAEWYPNARKMKRKIVMHVGPTNSGKTHHALKAFAAAKSGYYAGPLRLLAREIYERFNGQGTSCNLVTGEEVVPVVDKFGNVATLSSGTIEMIPLHTKMDICIIDEIQMIADPQRGSAWTNAVLGVQAKELHLCGEERAVANIMKLAESTGDIMEVKRYKRLGKLTVCEKPVGNVKNLVKGDCVVVFSKKKILDLKCQIEQATNFKVGIVYGALPPEIRSQEAAKFNSGEYDVLVASDAIGMGLNLKIKRVVFYATKKFDGTDMVNLSVSATKQIAGRAGRYSSEGELEGFVSALSNESLLFIRKTMKQPVEDIKRACIWPPAEFWTAYTASFRRKMQLPEAVTQFETNALKETMKNYFLSEFSHQYQILQLIVKHKIDNEMTIEDQLKLALVPLNLEFAAPVVTQTALKFFRCILKCETRTVFDFEFLYHDLLQQAPTLDHSSDQVLKVLAMLEENHKLVLVFMWLSQRWPTLFVDKESAHDVKTLIEKRISEQLLCLRLVSRREKNDSPPRRASQSRWDNKPRWDNQSSWDNRQKRNRSQSWNR